MINDNLHISRLIIDTKRIPSSLIHTTVSADLANLEYNVRGGSSCSGFGGATRFGGTASFGVGPTLIPTGDTQRSSNYLRYH